MAITLPDANGAAIAVGATVKLVGVVTELDPLNNRFNDVSITLTHPLTGIADTMVSPGGNLSTTGAQLNTSKTIQVASTMLVVGA